MITMSKVDLRRVDLNLLVALEVLLEECHITNSANRLNLSQPAMSRTLSRLRMAFDDPLLIRVPNGYERTERAENLAERLKGTLSQIRLTFARPTFDPTTASGVFKIGALDYAELVVLPAFMRTVTDNAPNMQIEIVRKDFYSIDEVLDGSADLSIGIVPDTAPKHCMVQKLFNDDYVCAMHKDHPLANSELTMDGYLEYPHATIHTGPSHGSVIDDTLEQLGHKRFIAKRSPHFITSLMTLEESNLMQSTAKRSALALQKAADLVVKELPFPMKPVTISQTWHARHNHNPSHIWFREQVALAAKAPPDDGGKRISRSPVTIEAGTPGGTPAGL